MPKLPEAFMRAVNSVMLSVCPSVPSWTTQILLSPVSLVMEKPRVVQLLRKQLSSLYLRCNVNIRNSAWHGYKYIDPAESGAVLPIVHVNGFKISERTIYGTMDNKEMVALFT